jgi:hypothetical protein
MDQWKARAGSHGILLRTRIATSGCEQDPHGRSPVDTASLHARRPPARPTVPMEGNEVPSSIYPRQPLVKEIGAERGRRRPHAASRAVPFARTGPPVDGYICLCQKPVFPRIVSAYFS